MLVPSEKQVSPPAIEIEWPTIAQVCARTPSPAELTGEALVFGAKAGRSDPDQNHQPSRTMIGPPDPSTRKLGTNGPITKPTISGLF